MGDKAPPSGSEYKKPPAKKMTHKDKINNAINDKTSLTPEDKKKLLNLFNKSINVIKHLENNIDGFNNSFYKLFNGISINLKSLLLNLATKLGKRSEIIYEETDPDGKIRLKTVVPRGNSSSAPGVVPKDTSDSELDKEILGIFKEIQETKPLILDEGLKEEIKQLEQKIEQLEKENNRLNNNIKSSQNIVLAKLAAKTSEFKDTPEFYKSFYEIYSPYDPSEPANIYLPRDNTPPSKEKQKPIQIRKHNPGGTSRKPQSGGKRRRSRSKSKKIVKRRSRSKSRKLIKRRSRSRK